MLSWSGGGTVDGGGAVWQAANASSTDVATQPANDRDPHDARPRSARRGAADSCGLLRTAEFTGRDLATASVAYVSRQGNRWPLNKAVMAAGSGAGASWVDVTRAERDRCAS
jgi:hypothetical protein